MHLDFLYLNIHQCILVFVCLCSGNTPFGIDSMPELRKRRPIPLVSELVSRHHSTYVACYQCELPWRKINSSKDITES